MLMRTLFALSSLAPIEGKNRREVQPFKIKPFQSKKNGAYMMEELCVELFLATAN